MATRRRRERAPLAHRCELAIAGLALAALPTRCDLFAALSGGHGLRCTSDESCPADALCIDQRCDAFWECRNDADCTAGFFCHPQRRRCVRSSDTGASDATAADARPEAGRDDHAAVPDAAAGRDRADAASGDRPGHDGARDSGQSDRAVPDTGRAAACRVDAGAAGGVAVALPAPAATAVDGLVDEWSDACFVNIGRPDDWTDQSGYTAVVPADAATFRATFAWLWATNALLLAIVVDDDIHHNNWSGSDLWRGDCVQVGFDMARNGGSPYDATDDFEYGWANASGTTASYRWFAPAGQAPGATEFAMRRGGTRTVYEVRFNPDDLGRSAFAAGALGNISLLVADSDGAGRAGWLEWASGIGSAPKNPEQFLELRLTP